MLLQWLEPNLTFNLVGNGRFKINIHLEKIKLNVDIADLRKTESYMLDH
jgi:hypothetical protein